MYVLLIMYLLKNDIKNVFINMYYYYYYYSFSSSSPSPYVAQCYQYLAYGTYPTSVDGTVRSVTQQEVRSRAKDFLPPLLLTLSSSCCLFLAKVQGAHIHKLCRPLLPHPSCNHI